MSIKIKYIHNKQAIPVNVKYFNNWRVWYQNEMRFRLSNDILNRVFTGKNVPSMSEEKREGYYGL